tara:strand:+ start:373 stop:639 length:267 start_codon:yes stop_codon:yes gene_type:complete
MTDRNMMLTVDEYLALRRLIDSEKESEGAREEIKTAGETRRTRRKSSTQAAYSRAFKRIAPRNKKKNGTWKAGGFQRTVKAAWREVRK